MLPLYTIRNFPCLSILKEIAHIFSKKGFLLYVVGGAIRDFLLHRDVKDIDLCTNASPEQVKKIFPRTFPTGIAHGTVTVLYKKISFEITSFRIESTYSNHRSPDTVHYTHSLEKDIERRDFTINALAFDPLQEILIDIYDGIKDLEMKRIRCVGDAKKRFEEDALRILRAIRFSATLGFSIELQCKDGIQYHAALIAHISKERIWSEISKIFATNNVYPALAILHESTLFHQIFTFHLNAKELRYCKKIYTHSRNTTLSTEQTLCLHLAICFIVHKMYNPNTYTSILKSLTIPNKTLTLISSIITHSRYIPVKKKNNILKIWSIFKQNYFVYLLGIDTALLVLHYYRLTASSNHKKGEATRIIQCIDQYIETIQKNANTMIVSLQQLAINGNDIMTLDSSITGRRIGDLLKTALRYVLCSPTTHNKKHILLQYIAKRI